MSAQTAEATGRSIWKIDPDHSQVEFAVRHMMITTVKGFFSDLDGTIQLDEDDLSRSSVQVEIRTASIDTRNTDRDGHLRSPDFFDVDTHPTIQFRSTKVKGSKEDFQVTGELTIRGTPREVVLQGETLGGGTDPWGNERLGLRAETSIDRKDFGLTWNQALETGGVLVGEEVGITLDVQAVRAEDEDA